jgi:hypothetical protein
MPLQVDGGAQAGALSQAGGGQANAVAQSLATGNAQVNLAQTSTCISKIIFMRAEVCGSPPLLTQHN